MVTTHNRIDAAVLSRHRRRRWLVAMTDHPLLVVALVAGAFRAVAVVALGPLQDGVAVPDEAQYLGLAASVAAGHGAEAWQPGYGGSLYDTTASFMRPLSALTWAFGPHQVTGQLLAAGFGVMAAAVTALLALRIVRPSYAIAAGLTVAALPSQVYWSSVVLRESMVWTMLAGLGWVLALASSATGRRLALQAAIGLATLYLLCDLRQQTAVVAAWSLVVASLLARHRHRVLVPLGALAIAVLAPALTGLGPAGYTFVESAVPHLAVIRANLSLGAESSIVRTVPVAPSDPTPRPSASGGLPLPGVVGSPGPMGMMESAAPARPTAPPGGAVVTTASGESYIVEDSSSAATLSALPAGLVAVTVRPFPWEPVSSGGARLAKLENIGWVMLYALAIVGAAVGLRRRDVIAFPIVVGLAVLTSSAVTQGNLGTAFRHRGQLLWALALLAAVALQHIADRRHHPAP